MTEDHRASGKWLIAGVPHKGWICTDIDYEDEPSICQMCERQPINYVHRMEHDDYPSPLLCGCVCAGWMETDLLSAKKRDEKKKRQVQKLHQDAQADAQLKAHPIWRTSLAKNNPCFFYDDADGTQWRCTVYDRRGSWYFIINPPNDVAVFSHGKGRRGYADAPQAKKQAVIRLNQLLDMVVRDSAVNVATAPARATPAPINEPEYMQRLRTMMAVSRRIIL